MNTPRAAFWVCITLLLAIITTAVVMSDNDKPASHPTISDCRLSVHDCGYGDNATNGDH